VGLHLVAAGDPESAGKFFREAEKSLDFVVKKTPDSAAHDKAQFLIQLAFLHGQFLGQPGAAKAELEAALALRPDDPQAKAALRRLRSENADLFKAILPRG
jgi:hypothetical protein